MAWGWDESADAHDRVYNDKHEGHLSHELIGGAASFAAFKAYEDKRKAEGQEVDHAFAKEVLAGLAGAEVDKLFETKGLDEIDKIRAHEHAKQNAERIYDERYGNNNY